MFKPAIITNLPPRTKAPKYLNISANAALGNLALTLWGGWTEYKPEEVKTLIESLQSYLDNVIYWTCPKCSRADNVTIPHTDGVRNTQPWVKCRECKAKTKLKDLGLTL